MNGCLILVVQCEGRQVTTIEGIAPGDDELHPVQAAFIRHDAFQCGYCTPGQTSRRSPASPRAMPAARRKCASG